MKCEQPETLMTLYAQSNNFLFDDEKQSLLNVIDRVTGTKGNKISSADTSFVTTLKGVQHIYNNYNIYQQNLIGDISTRFMYKMFKEFELEIAKNNLFDSFLFSERYIDRDEEDLFNNFVKMHDFIDSAFKPPGASVFILPRITDLFETMSVWKTKRTIQFLKYRNLNNVTHSMKYRKPGTLKQPGAFLLNDGRQYYITNVSWFPPYGEYQYKCYRRNRYHNLIDQETTI